MNNTQFRRLVLDTSNTSKSNEITANATPRPPKTTPSVLGSRMNSSIPMTPRAIAGSVTNNFSRQLAERNAELTGTQVKRFRASAAPKGSKLAPGYEDRTQLRASAEEDEKATRVKALEDMVKLGQIDEPTFKKLRDQITEGSLENVHLVKGLDFKLLKRIRQGEDVLAEKQRGPNRTHSAHPSVEPDVDVEGELEKLEEKEIAPVAKIERSKKGNMAPPPPIAGRKRTRDEILKDLKAARLAAAEEAKARQPTLGARFKKVGDKRGQSHIEKDEKGRDVLMLIDADGNVKRKIKKAKPEHELHEKHGLLMPDKDTTPLGMDVAPTAHRTPPEEGDLDIFEGIGTDFNPLGVTLVDGEDDSDSTDEMDDQSADAKYTSTEQDGKRSGPQQPSEPEGSKTGPQNYFKDNETQPAIPLTHNPLTDPTILAALKKASAIQPLSSALSENDEEAAKLERRRRMLESGDRDAEDMDMGFGGSRFGDEDADDGKKEKLSTWGAIDGDERGSGRVGKEKRKRGSKKKKGDGENAVDVMKILERRKGEKA